MQTVIILPTFNERENLAATVHGILRSTTTDVRILIVDDASADGTGEVADALTAENPTRLFVLHRVGRRGLGGAYLEGFRFAADSGAEIICEMDADGSHDPAALPALLAAIKAGADTVIGSRRVVGGKIVGWGVHRHLMSGGATGFARLILGLQTRDATSGFRAYRREVAAALLGTGIGSEGYAFQEETVFHTERLGFRLTEVPITFIDRKRGKSKLSWKEVPDFFKTIFRLLKRYGRIQRARIR